MWKKVYRLLRYDWPLHFVLVLTNWLPDNVVFIKLRGLLAKPFFLKAGSNLQIGRDVTFYNPSNIEIGKNVYIARGTWFSAGERIKIQDNILFGPYVVVVTSDHSIENSAYYFGPPVNKKSVEICSGSWIGAHSTILAGSYINKTVLIGANSVFKGSSQEKGIYGGVPAKLIKIANE